MENNVKGKILNLQKGVTALVNRGNTDRVDLDQVEAKSEDIKESIAYLAALLPEWSRPVGSRPRALQIQNTWT